MWWCFLWWPMMDAPSPHQIAGLAMFGIFGVLLLAIARAENEQDKISGA